MTNLVLVRDHPWERMEAETDPAFHAFQHYRDLGFERSLTKAMEEHRGCPGGKARENTWEEWSSKNEWVERCAAWDSHLDSIRVGSFEETAAEMGKRHASQAADALAVLAAPAKALAKVIADGSDVMEGLATLARTDTSAFIALVDLVKVTAGQLPALAKMEREARGLGAEGEVAEQQTVRVVVKLDEGFRL